MPKYGHGALNYRQQISCSTRSFACWGEEWQNKDRHQLSCNKTVLCYQCVEAQYTLKMFSCEEGPFNRKLRELSSFIFPEILVKNAVINDITPQKIDSLFS